MPNPSRLLVFDNGNQRVVQGGVVHSRGQVLELDETNRTAKLVLNADLGVLSMAVGSAQALHNGDYHFEAGFVSSKGQLFGFSIEVDPSGQAIATLQASSGLYRSFRMTDIYTPE